MNNCIQWQVYLSGSFAFFYAYNLGYYQLGYYLIIISNFDDLRHNFIFSMFFSISNIKASLKVDYVLYWSCWQSQRINRFVEPHCHEDLSLFQSAVTWRILPVLKNNLLMLFVLQHVRIGHIYFFALYQAKEDKTSYTWIWKCVLMKYF